jgi:hypothetical protein
MMSIPEILGFLLLAAGGWFVWDSLRVREAANAAMRAACKAEGLLFLDDTVALESIWPVRHDEGQLTLRRVYGFEYSDTGDTRRKGRIVMLADTVFSLDIGARPPPAEVTFH